MNYKRAQNLRYILVTIGTLLILLSISALFLFLRKENPETARYQCSKLFDFGEQEEHLKEDYNVNTISAINFEEKINPISLVFNRVSAISGKISLMQDLNEVISKSNDLHKINSEQSFTIPKQACYTSLDFEIYDLYTLNDYINTQDDLITQPQKIIIYNWIKKYSNYLDQEYNEANYILFINDNFIHMKQTSSTFSGTSKVSVYKLPKEKPA